MYTAISLKNPEKLKPKITETDQSATKDVPGISKMKKARNWVAVQYVIKMNKIF